MRERESPAAGRAARRSSGPPRRAGMCGARATLRSTPRRVRVRRSPAASARSAASAASAAATTSIQVSDGKRELVAAERARQSLHAVDPRLLEQGPKLADEHRQRLLPGGRRRVAPQCLRQLVSWDGTSVMGEEIREDESALTSRKALLWRTAPPPVSIRTWSVSETLTATRPPCRPLAAGLPSSCPPREVSAAPCPMTRRCAATADTR